MSSLNKLFAGLATVLILAQGQPVAALPEDREQPIKITADKAVRNEKRGLTVYSGNVHMEQGSLTIRADTLTIFRIVEEADRIVAEGSPVELQQLPALDEPPMHATAGVIEYYKLEDRLHMRHDARIEQDGSIVTGETIDYLINEQVVEASSNQSVDDSRVEVVIPARVIQESELDDDTPDSE
jgi:lipopolysaccharide export system protein LptA